MNDRQLTPYDTGARLEPQLWPLGEADSYGRVDFDDTEGRTVCSVHIERAGAAYVMHVVGETDALFVTGERGAASILNAQCLAGIPELLALAQRGRTDFEHQVLFGDYSPEDIAAADRQWATACATVEALRRLTRHPS